jgi:predicted AAA+ superfamily ATPase
MQRIIRQKIIDSLVMPIPAFTRRDARLPVVRGKATAVIGMRRTGKTTFLWQILSDRLKSGTEREGLLYFSFEDERLAGMTAADLHLVVEEYYLLHPEWRDNRRAVFFFDEIQNVPGWERFIRRLIDTEKVELFLSGSSARLLSRELATSMRGRAMETIIHPFSFREYLRHFGREPERAPNLLPKAERSMLEKEFREYLRTGGFPEALGIDARDRNTLLNGYVDVVLLRDVVERYAVSHPVALRWMTRQLLGKPAGSFSVSKFYNDLRSQGIPVAKDTLHAYLGYLEDAFLIRSIFLSTESERRRMINPRKVYPEDPGLIPIFDRSGRDNTGHALETCVLKELERRGAEFAYVRTANRYEVDFSARFPEGNEELIQVCAEMDNTDVCEREYRALVEASREYPRASLHIISLGSRAALAAPANVTVHSAVDWFLKNTTTLSSR